MNTRKPTKREVPDDVMCWYWYIGYHPYSWIRRSGAAVRAMWDHGDRWLPYDAIPDPTQTTTKKGRKP